MWIHVLTLFPGIFDGFLKGSIVRIAQEKGALRVNLVDFRNFTDDRHGTVDDRPFGGGPGMLLKPEPIFRAIEDLERARGPLHKVLLTPGGRRLDQQALRRLRERPELLVLCGRYEGIDDRVRQGFEWEEVSLGDFVLSGGEVPAMALIDGVARLLPGVLGDEESAVHESFEQDDLLDHPQYTRPRTFRDMTVPEVLVSGHHKEIEAWRAAEARRRTEERSSPRSPNEPNQAAGSGTGATPAPQEPGGAKNTSTNAIHAMKVEP